MGKKAIFRRALLLILCASLYLVSSNGHAQSKKGFADAFDDQTVSNWFGNDHFAISEKEQVLKVTMNKHPWEAFSVNLDGIDLTEDPFLIFKVKASEDLKLRVDIHDEEQKDLHDDGTIHRKIPSVMASVAGSGEFQTIFLDFSNTVDRIRKQQVSHLLFYVNPGESFQGEIMIKDFCAGDATYSLAREMNQKSGSQIVMIPNPATYKTQLKLYTDHGYDRLVIRKHRGQVILNRKISTTQEHVNLNMGRYEKGVYIALLYGPNNRPYSTTFWVE
ncbi:MAG: hypothetical protein AAFX87_16580 [Bacteroidota bacterium]